MDTKNATSILQLGAADLITDLPTALTFDDVLLVPRLSKVIPSQVDVTTRFRTLTPAAIERYLQRERPYDCAASIKCEALGIAIVESIQSDDPTALIGLPLITVVDLLHAEGVDVLAAGDAPVRPHDHRSLA